MGERPSFVPSFFPTYVPFSVNVFIPKDLRRENILFFTGLLNSKLILVWFSHNAKKRGIGLEINGNVLKRTPIHIIEDENFKDIMIRDRIVELVEHILKLYKRSSQTPYEQEQLEREITTTDAQIDRLVYDLYGLTDEEIKIVEGENEIN